MDKYEIKGQNVCKLAGLTQTPVVHIFSTAVCTVVLMQSVLCKPYIFTK